MVAFESHLNIGTSADAEHESVIDLDDFTIRREPLLRSLTPLQGSALQSGDAIRVSHSRLAFTLAPEDVVIKHGTVLSSLFGATMSGKIGLAGVDVKLRGAILPFFDSGPTSFQRVYLNPPETLITLSYGIEGRAEARSLRLDPFGPLAPALLRELLALEESRSWRDSR